MSIRARPDRRSSMKVSVIQESAVLVSQQLSDGVRHGLRRVLPIKPDQADVECR